MRIRNRVYFPKAYQKWAKSNQISEKKLPGFTHYSAEQMLFISFGQLWCSKLSDQYARVQHSDDTHAPSQFRYISLLLHNGF